ncbi:class I SAM-dependent methyltransferase [Endozoicomonadaceae bacterium StTr2]
MANVAVSKEVEAGQAVYTRLLLRVYDLWVLFLSNRFIWKCPSSIQLAHYNRHIGASHLDVGVGTGYFLRHCKFPVADPRIGLIDLNPNSLAFTSRRIRRYRPEYWRANVLEPLNIETAPFDSIGLNYLFHCLPGTLKEKGVALDNLLPLLKPGGTVFGTTLLSGGVFRTPRARALMRFYNGKGIFSNEHDGLEQLEEILAARFSEYNVRVVGCVALFSAIR